MKPNGTTVTAADVAKKAGVSKWTVIRAFQPDARIAAQTRERVLSVARELHYQPNLLARSLATSRTHQVAILVDDFENPYKLPTLSRLTAKLQAEGLLAFLVNVNEDFPQNAAIIDARQRRIDSIIFFGSAYDPASISDQVLDATQQPIFVLARESVSHPLPSVFTDPRHAIEELSNHAFERGYRNPVYIAGPTRAYTAVGRRQQYRKFWKAKGVDPMPEINAGAYEFKAACDSIKAHFVNGSGGAPYDVVLCENDLLALAALETLRYDFGLRVPEDVAVVGFDDISLAGFQSISLTTYRQPFAEMVDELIEMVVGRKVPESIALRGELVIRSTT